MAYSITENYKQVIYSGDSRHKIKILFNNVELQEADRYCERATIKSRILPNGAKRFSLNNFISKEVEIILHDIDTSIIQDKVSISIGTLVGNAYEYVPIGIFNIQGTPTTDKNKITIKLRDNSVKFDFNYNAKPLIDEKGGSATKLQILQDICSKANVTCNISSFLGSTDSIGIYDNTITARQYIADIAEQAGRIATINRNGELIFVNLNSLTTWNIPLSIVERYELGKAYRIGKVVYEDAIRKYETASTNYDTLYLDSSNPYISSQSQVNSILQQVNNFAIDSVKTGKILGNPAIDGYDLINVYNDKVEGNPSVFKTLATNELVYTGVLINTFDTQIGEEERKENVSIVGEATFKKWATTNINNINGEIDIQAGKIDNVEKEINPTQDATGTSFYLEDSTNAELVNFEMEGKTTQETSTQSANLCPPFTDSRWTFTNGASVTNEGYLSIPATTGAKATIIIPWNKSRTCYFKDIIVSGGNAHYAGEYFDESGTLLSSNGKAIFDKDANYQDGTMWGGNNQYGDALTQTTSIKFTIQFSNYTSNPYVIKDLIISENDINYIPFTPNMPSPDYPSELVSVGYENYFEAEYLQTTANTNINANLYKNTYTLSLENKENFGGVIYIQLYKNNTLITTNGHLLNTSSAVSFSTSSYWYYFSNIPNGNKLTFTLDDDYSLKIALSNATGSQKAFLVKGTQQHSYIPYGKYGIEVKTTSKNSWDNKDYQTQLTTNNYTIENNGFTFTRGSLTGGRYIAKKITVKEGITYTFSAISNDWNTNFYLIIYRGNVYRTNVASSTNGKVTYTATANEDLFFTFIISSGQQNASVSNIQVEKNSQATEFEPYYYKIYTYSLNQPLRGIGDTKDLLYIKNGMLYVERKIGSVVLDGTQSISLVNWRASSTSVGWIYPYNLTKNATVPAIEISKVLSNQLQATSYNKLYGQSVDNGIAVYNNTGFGIVIRTSNTSLTTASAINSYLSQNPIIVDYELAEPNTEGLGKIEVPITYKNITHINTTDDNEPNMNITYVRDTQLTNYVEEHISQIIVNEEGITQRVENIENNGLEDRITTVETQQTSTDFRINAISKNVTFTEFDEDGNPINSNINSVTTTTGFTFNENGLNIKKSDTDYNTLIDNTGTYYKDGETIISMTNKDGFLAKDFRLQGQHYYSYNGSDPTHPLASENYDFVDERIEVEVDGQTQYAYATFYNGEV